MESCFKGRLKLAIYINCGHLTIHIKQAKHLTPEWSNECNAYVKICLKPDENKRSCCHTAIVYSPNNQPVFEEKFSFELLEEDLRKRIVISVWNKDPRADHVEFLGSMSFGLHHINLKHKVIDGWYYLLNEQLGRHKHLKVVTSSDDPAYVEQHCDYSEPLIQLESHVFVIPRGFPDGFGFGLVGSAPVTVSRVDPGSPAESSGLQVRDRIVRINNISVDYSTSEIVGRIIKNSGKKVIVEVQRPICKFDKQLIPSVAEDNVYAELREMPFPHDPHAVYGIPHRQDCPSVYASAPYARHTNHDEYQHYGSSSSDLVSAGPMQKQQFCAQWLSAQTRVPIQGAQGPELGSGGSEDRSWDNEDQKKKNKKKSVGFCVPLRSQKVKMLDHVT